MIKATPKSEIFSLISLLKDRGYRVIGPVFRDGVVLFEELENPEDLAVGVVEEQEEGKYRAFKVEGDGRFFGYTHGPNSLKHFLHPTNRKLLKIKPDLSQEIELEEERYAFIGVRGCDLRALYILDNVFINKNPHPDVHYRALREKVFIVAINCTSPADTCFCTSMGTGPYVEEGFDIALTELKDGFLARSGSERGKELLNRLKGREPREEDLKEERKLIGEAEDRIKRRVNTEGLPQKLLERLEDPAWEEVARRCLACGSCTMVCPTCFCYEVIDDIEMDGSESSRIRRWDVCFRTEFSAIHGVPIRASVKAKYRQWLMHKFSYWVGQFGEFGCVGCGRCIAWCPVGIDITEEVRRVVGD